jgi:hypothetical protein
LITGGNGAIGKILLANATDERWSPSASPRMRSLVPIAYISALSKSVTPKASARCTMSRATPVE